jgi:hypothetical protein
MNSPCTSFVRACPPIASLVAICPSSSVSHVSPMSAGDYLPNSFLDYLFDEEKENSLASHVEETRALELGFCKEDVVGKEGHVGRS